MKKIRAYQNEHYSVLLRYLFVFSLILLVSAKPVIKAVFDQLEVGHQLYEQDEKEDAKEEKEFAEDDVDDKEFFNSYLLIEEILSNKVGVCAHAHAHHTLFHPEVLVPPPKHS